jgi:hypothetical protein
LFNGRRPFKVCFDTTRFWVYRDEDEDDYEDGKETRYCNKVVMRRPYKKVFVGKSPINRMTKFSGGHGPEWDGNSMLFELESVKGHKYMFIGDVAVYTFRTTNRITTFVSPVGNNSVPYPFAIDSAGAIYLMLERVVFTPKPKRKGVLTDPYDYYYKAIDMQGFDGNDFYIGSKKSSIHYSPHAADQYDRIVKRIERGGSKGVKMYLRGRDNPDACSELTKRDYIALHARFGRVKGLAPMNETILVEV